MAKDKERSVNPAQQQRKLDKAKALKKSKAELQTRRNEKLAKRNPDRIQRQIDDLKALEATGDIKAREKAILADLERDHRAVLKARDSLGTNGSVRTNQPYQPRNRPEQGQNTLGKRRHDGQRKFNDYREPSGSDTDESLRNIPWPRDTPPPVPKEFRRARNPEVVPAQPIVAKTTYESAPQIRDLKQEAVSRFVPNVVKRKQEAVRGMGGQLLEPEELDRLEREGYLKTETGSNVDGSHNVSDMGPKFSEYKPKSETELQSLQAEEEAFEKEIALQSSDRETIAESRPHETTIEKLPQSQPKRKVEIEEVEDEDL